MPSPNGSSITARPAALDDTAAPAQVAMVRQLGLGGVRPCPTAQQATRAHKSSDSQAEQDWRPWGVGGSDIGALLGVSPYRCAVDVWLEKVSTGNGAAPKSALPMRLGNFLEPFVVREYERLTSNKTRRQDAALHHPDHPELFGHVDRIATMEYQTGDNSDGASTRDIVLECKTCSAFRAKEWGPSWSDQVPAEYLAQCLWYLGLANCEEAHLAVLLGNTDFRVYRIKRDRDIERHMFELAHSFWVEHVLTKRPPPAKTRAQAQSLHPTPDDGRAQQAGDQTLSAIKRKAQLEVELLKIQSEIERLNDSVAVFMGAAERLTWQGKTLATWRLSKGAARLDGERLRRERPDIAESYTVQSPATRRLQINTTALKQCTTQE